MAEAGSILIICDKPLAISLARALVSMRYPAKVAGTLHAAYTILRSTPPDIAIISSGIAGGSGVWLAGRIRESYPAIRLILWAAGPEPRTFPDVPVIRKDYDLTEIITAAKHAVTTKPAARVDKSPQVKPVSESADAAVARKVDATERASVDRLLKCPVPLECPICHESAIRASFNAGRWRAKYLCGSEIRIGTSGVRGWETECPQTQTPPSTI